MAYRIVLRRDTSTNWTTNNPVLLLGEPGYETDTARMKIGDGSTLWADLPYYVGYDLLALDSDLIPATGGTYDLGATAGYSWRDLYLSGNTIYLGDATLSAVGSSVSMDTIILGGPTADGGVSLSATGGYLTSDGSLLAEDRLTNGDLEVILDSSGTLNTPLLLPISFNAICDEAHMIDPVTFEGSDWWEFEVEFQVSSYGTVAVMINNIFPIPTNPGYESGYTFRFTEADHGIPNYNFDIQLNDVVQAGPAGWTSNLEVTQGPEYPSTIESLGAIKITSNSNSIILGTDGVLYIPNGIEFPLSNGNNRTGEGNNLQFEKGSAFQKIISTQDGTELVPTVERLVISGGDSYFDGSEYSGEGGDIYLWAGQGQNGGDIKVDAGESTSEQGGTVKVRGGYSSESFGGFVEIWSGAGALGGGDISITAQNGGTAAQSGGEIYLETRGNTTNTWIFKNDGNLRFPNGTIQETAFEGEILPIETTYSELYSGVTGGSLIPGAYYLITNFRTCYDQPDYDTSGTPITVGNYKQGAIEPIIVFATSSNTISTTAYQPEYPNDRIQYDWTFNTTEVTEGTAFGRISERIDEFNNRTDYDHRTILFKRYRLFTYREELNGSIELLSDGTVNGVGTSFNSLSVGDVIYIPNVSPSYFEIVSISSDTIMTVSGDTINSGGPGMQIYNTVEETNDSEGYFSYKQTNVKTDDYLEYTTFGDAIDQDYAKNNYVGNYANNYTNIDSGTFILANNVFLEGQYESNKFGDYCYNNTFGTDNQNNIWGDFCYENVSVNDIDDNIIGHYFNRNLINVNLSANNIGHYFNNNRLLAENSEDFEDNIIGNNFNSNTIYSWFRYNEVLNDFGYNTIGDFISLTNFQFGSNKIGNGFYSNTISDNVNNNVIGNQFENNTLSSDFNDNKIGNEFKGNLISGQFELNDIGSFVGGNQFSVVTYQNKFGSYTFDNDFLGSVFNNSCMGDFNNNILETFSNNKIQNGFSNNILGNDFANNEIGNNFGNNIIDDNFGSGAGAPQGNKIGNNFQDNTIGEYFYNNSIPDNFSGNTIGNYFEWNTIDTRIESTDFTLNYGNITGFYYIAGGTSGVDNTYIGLTGSVSGGATGGIGSGASFDIGVTGGTVYSVILNTAGSQYTTNDTITILGTAIGGITGGIQTFTSDAIGKTGATGTYIGLIAGGTAGGENASFNVTVTSSLVSDIQIYDKGVAYSIGDNLTILGSQFGGTDGSDDISITVSNLYSDSIVIGITGISQTPSVYEEYTCQIFERQGGNKRLSFYDENDVLTIKNINE